MGSFGFKKLKATGGSSIETLLSKISKKLTDTSIIDTKNTDCISAIQLYNADKDSAIFHNGYVILPSGYFSLIDCIVKTYSVTGTILVSKDKPDTFCINDGSQITEIDLQTNTVLGTYDSSYCPSGSGSDNCDNIEKECLTDLQRQFTYTKRDDIIPLAIDSNDQLLVYGYLISSLYDFLKFPKQVRQAIISGNLIGTPVDSLPELDLLVYYQIYKPLLLDIEQHLYQYLMDVDAIPFDKLFKRDFSGLNIVFCDKQYFM